MSGFDMFTQSFDCHMAYAGSESWIFRQSIVFCAIEALLDQNPEQVKTVQRIVKTDAGELS